MLTFPLLNDNRVLIVAPSGNDAENTAHVLGVENIAVVVCGTVEEACTEAKSGAGALLLTQETMTSSAINHLGALLRQQPPWSDIPVIC